MTTYTVSNLSALNQDIEAVDQATTGAFEIQFTGSIQGAGTIDAIALNQDLELTIDGRYEGVSYSILGGGGLEVLSGDVTIENLGIVKTAAAGGAGQDGGGGGAGLGGGLFVGANADVTLSDVSFIDDQAIGGDGGAKGGGQARCPSKIREAPAAT